MLLKLLRENDLAVFDHLADHYVIVFRFIVDDVLIDIVQMPAGTDHNDDPARLNQIDHASVVPLHLLALLRRLKVFFALKIVQKNDVVVGAC